jgi:2-polyprenyl-3-methyl-5-hydroxy-6-metoxy-1,4-benzoquinol methylase
MISPITGTPNVILERTIPTKDIVEGYRSVYNIDVSSNFKDVEFIELYKCQASGLFFYSPSSISGSESFYEELQKIPWYYQQWKWEYQIVMDNFKGANSLLEIGCGDGAFLAEMSKSGTDCLGLELNNQAVLAGKKRNVNIINSTIEKYVNETANTFDVVCSFQVLEHVADVKSFLESSLKALRKGGRLVFAVPNNDILFFKYRNFKFKHDHYLKTLLLNLPPHHMGLWTPQSIVSLSSIYNLKFESLFKEPLNHHRKQLVESILIEKFVVGKVIARFPRRMQEWLFQQIFASEFEYADTMIAVFVKE